MVYMKQRERHQVFATGGLNALR
uniref:Uncharacterized protein n=1 Tax=Rhizophora mucronata TaxID=61149 RepID=A0A2P2IJW1_RHIMU